MTIVGNHDVVHEVVKRERLMTREGRYFTFACGRTLQLYYQYPRRRNVTCMDCIAAGAS